MRDSTVLKEFWKCIILEKMSNYGSQKSSCMKLAATYLKLFVALTRNELGFTHVVFSSQEFSIFHTAPLKNFPEQFEIAPLVETVSFARVSSHPVSQPW